MQSAIRSTTLADICIWIRATGDSSGFGFKGLWFRHSTKGLKGLGLKGPGFRDLEV